MQLGAEDTKWVEILPNGEKGQRRTKEGEQHESLASAHELGGMKSRAQRRRHHHKLWWFTSCRYASEPGIC
eukprot:760918-Hanusia_phi.AAC.3